MGEHISTISVRVCYANGDVGCGNIFLDDVIECPCCKRPAEECEQMEMVVMLTN